MKRSSKFLSVLLALTAVLMLLGCEVGVNKPSIEKRPSANSDLARTYKNIVGLQVSYAKKTIDTVQQYVDLPEQNGRGVLAGTFDFSDIGKYLPTDLSTLKRTKQSRSAVVSSEVNLEDELNVLLAQFETEFQGALPDPSLALTLPFVKGVEEGLLIGGDMLVPYNSLSGALTVELLNAYAAGLDVQEIVKELEGDLPSFFSSLGVSIENDASRGLYKKGVGVWPNGVVNYRWGNIHPTHKDSVRVAMSTWSAASGNRISWRELPNAAWENAQLTLQAIGNITISNNANISGGRATIGYFGGNNNYLQIKTSISDDTSLKHLSLHELGHSLGLNHEHQRHDRDRWVTVTVPPGDDPADYEKIPKDIEGWRIQYLRIRLGLWTISIPYLAFWNETNSYAIGIFDFQSIMLYGYLPVKERNSTISSTATKTPYNTTLSPTDISTIRYLY
jgi:hypothetical protein